MYVNSAEFRTALLRRARRAGLAIEPELIPRLEAYFDLLARWNVKINLTALPLAKPTDETFDRLLVEPLSAVTELEAAPLRWFDLGSGGGSPAIPIKLAKPVLKLTMVESKVRKAAFLRDVIRQLMLEAAVVENVRFEALVEQPELRGVIDLVTVRAVRVDEPFVDVCRYLLKPGGLLRLFGWSAPQIFGGFTAGPRAGMLLRLTADAEPRPKSSRDCST